MSSAPSIITPRATPWPAAVRWSEKPSRNGCASISSGNRPENAEGLYLIRLPRRHVGETSAAAAVAALLHDDCRGILSGRQSSTQQLAVKARPRCRPREFTALTLARQQKRLPTPFSATPPLPVKSIFENLPIRRSKYARLPERSTD